ncbi:MAG: glycine cleavage system protein GcvH, partial [Candidatus Bathyarchaeia archaeon]
MTGEQYETPPDLLYTKEHEWVRLEDRSTVTVGITDYAAKSLHDIVYVSLPTVNTDFSRMNILGSVESIKAVSEIYSPISGRVVTVNSELTTHPDIINKSPYKDGWIARLTSENLAQELQDLMKPENYVAYLSDLTA